MNKRILTLILIITLVSLTLPKAQSETGGSTKIDCTILTNEGGNTDLMASGNTGTVGKDVILGCMGLPGAFTGDTTLTISGSTGNESVATVFPFQNNLPVNSDGSTDTVNVSIMITSAGATDIAVDFAGEKNFDVNSTLWTFSSMSTSSSTSTSGQPSSSTSSSSTSSSGSVKVPCGSSISQCKSQSTKSQCKACCGSVKNKSCKSRCNKNCKKLTS